MTVIQQEKQPCRTTQSKRCRIIVGLPRLSGFICFHNRNSAKDFDPVIVLGWIPDCLPKHEIRQVHQQHRLSGFLDAEIFRAKRSDTNCHIK